MKSSLKVLLILMLIGSFSPAVINAQDYPATVIDVIGSKNGDTMWLFTVEGTTPTFDSGWDGIKMTGSTIAPQIFAIGSDYNYQVYTSFNVNHTSIGFIPGTDTVFNMRITNYNLSPTYSQLYLYDRKTRKVAGIYDPVTNLTFMSSANDEINRFEILTVIESDTTTCHKKDKSDKHNKGRGNNHGRNCSKSLKAFTLGANLFVENMSNKEGEAVIINPKSGARLTRFKVDACGITSKRVNLPFGNYIVNITNGIETGSFVITF